MKSSGTRRGHPWIRYAGTHEEVQWDITLRTDVMLPLRAVRRYAGTVEQLTMVSVEPMTGSVTTPVPVDGYGMLDFADLGDNERDPFVLRVQNHLGVGHAH